MSKDNKNTDQFMFNNTLEIFKVAKEFKVVKEFKIADGFHPIGIAKEFLNADRFAHLKVPEESKPFDISEYQCPDTDELDSPYIQIDNCNGNLIVDGNVNESYARAIAKHFKLI